MITTPEEFLRGHDMYYTQMPFEELTGRYRQEMEAGLAGRPSSLFMLPSYILAGAEPRRGEDVLVLDAGGTNLRAGRIRFDADGRPEVVTLKKCHMPGTGGREVTADEMFGQMAGFAAEAAEGCTRACISFSYPCRNRPDGDGEILELCKELTVTGAEGRLVCASLEEALRARGVTGRRRWRLVNDSVGSLLGGMASVDRRAYTDYLGFILGTGTNLCCAVPSAAITKAPEAAAMGGEMIVNMESGCFDKLLTGTADRAVDAASELPGDHLAEKMISGSYYRRVLTETLRLAAREGAISAGCADGLAAVSINSQMVDAFCLEPEGDNPIARALATGEDRRFAAGVNAALLERAARVAAAGLAAAAGLRAPAPGGRVCICADGTMLRRNPVLRPAMERYLREYVTAPLGVQVEFFFAEDATIKGSAWAGLIE